MLSLPYLATSNTGLRRFVLPFCFAAMGALASWPCVADLSVDEIHAGDRGVGLATFHGTEPSEYEVEILHVLRGDADTVDALLVRVSGAEIEAAGGIAAGMSGSPIYIGGELAAVLSYAIPDADPHYGYATPAQYLTHLLGDAPAPIAWAPPAGLPVGSQARGPLSSLMWQAARQVGGVVAPSALAPGHAVGVQIARGDIHVTTYGTVSAVRDGRALLLGHKYLHEGPCEYPLVRAEIGAIIPSSKVPFEMGSPIGEPIGTVVQDRGAGLVAELGRMPNLAPVSIDVSSDGGASRRLSVELVPVPEVFRETAASATIAAADGVLDRVGPGSAKLTVRLYTDGGYVVDRSDVISSTSDVGGACAAEVREILDAAFYGPLFELKPARAEVVIAASSRTATARVASVEAIPSQVQAGASTLVVATVRPVGERMQRIQISLPVPPETPPGSYLVRVHARAADGVGRFDPWEPGPLFDTPAEYCNWLSRSGRRSSLACDLIDSPFGRLLSGEPASIGFDDSGEMGTRDVPDADRPARAGGMASLLATGDVLERVLLDSNWSLDGEAVTRLVVTP